MTIGQVSTEPRPGPNSSHWLMIEACSILSQTLLEASHILTSDVNLTLCESLPSYLVISLQRFLNAVSTLLPWLWLLGWGMDPLPAHPHPVFSP